MVEGCRWGEGHQFLTFTSLLAGSRRCQTAESLVRKSTGKHDAPAPHKKNTKQKQKQIAHCNKIGEKQKNKNGGLSGDRLHFATTSDSAIWMRPSAPESKVPPLLFVVNSFGLPSSLSPVASKSRLAATLKWAGSHHSQ